LQTESALQNIWSVWIIQKRGETRLMEPLATIP
jgi:hypothetical protein